MPFSRSRKTRDLLCREPCEPAHPSVEKEEKKKGQWTGCGTLQCCCQWLFFQLLSLPFLFLVNIIWNNIYIIYIWDIYIRYIVIYICVKKGQETVFWMASEKKKYQAYSHTVTTEYKRRLSPSQSSALTKVLVFIFPFFWESSRSFFPCWYIDL